MQFKLSLLAVVVVAAVAALFVSPVADANINGHMAGGWTPMKQSDLRSDGFRQCLQAAAAEYNARFASSNGDAGGVAATVGSVSRAQKQVVSGMKYKFTARMTVPGCGEDCPDRSCEFTVWYQAWMPEPVKVLSVHC